MKSVISKMMMAPVVALMMFSGKAFAADSAGFSKGNNLKMVNLSGSIKVKSKCENHSRTPFTIIKCESNDLLQGNEDYFVGPANRMATEVELVAKGASGEVHRKSSNYDGAAGKSADTINLWYSTMLQSPLLEVGANQVMFILKNENGQEIQRGTFLVNVDSQPALECDQKTYSSLTPFECSMTKPTCQRYFKQNNFCQK